MELTEQLARLLGLGPTAEWPHSEKSLIELIELQKQKEVTKQEYYKLENKTKSIELMNYSLQAGIPSYLIPMIFSGDTIGDDVVQKLIASQQQQLQQVSIHSKPITRQTSPSRPLYTAYQDQHQQQQQQQHQQQHHSHQNPIQRPTQNLGPPVSLHTRPLSPAKIGAAAVAQLDRGRYPSSPVHKRYQSMPNNSPSLNNSPNPVVVVNSPSIQGIPRHQQSMMGVLNTDLQPVSHNKTDSTSDSGGGLQFINENPASGGRKRSRNSEELKNINEFTNIDEEPIEHENKENMKKIFRRKGHQRTRSENYLLDKQISQTTTPIRQIGNENLNEIEINDKSKTKNQNNNEMKVDDNDHDSKDQKGSETPKAGPKFANNILSSA
ncbi:hypothetical protein BN7_3182 [Wickerhamomyces ciferrii]|uniref:Uncharacterized protein n=1 Tax=Wickerhamomyces ciferrii (strain ATCC 14091 / BCRC 22168 / CBS 111 / JCM 3599 / NBRC 0793 / NRRL Y-1031 F-60-10) TaxID=1206466 RepID=K0KQI1_WICCF|nr:uncharacterized protein BN7_3182 [Wickerhamomyces ciferrii]CCH43629.1 hypothetical protein BN7_3182 [Wickerhamomyces ciferrii]